MIWAFGEFELDDQLYALRRSGEPVAVEPQVFDVLAYLVANRDRIVTKEELLDEVWGDRFVSESALTSRLKQARRAVGDDGRTQRVIQTVHGRGYRFVAELTASGGTAASAEELERQAETAWWTGDIGTAIGLRQTAHQQCLEAGDERGAARLAIQLAEDHYNRGALAVDRGWRRRAERLLADQHDAIEYAWLLRTNALRAIEVDRDFEEALALADEVMRRAGDLGSADLQALGLLDRGQALLGLGRSDEGMGLIDEAMTIAVSSDLSRRTAGRIYCTMIACCIQIADYRRAAEWTDAAITWCAEDAPSAPYPGVCRVNRAALLRRRGDFEEAVAEAERCTSFGDFVNIAGGGWYELGEVRMRVGDYEGAESAFMKAHAAGYEPLPGLAWLRLAQAQPDAARSLAQRALADAALSPAERARLLSVATEAALALGDVAAATEAAAHLSQLASTDVASFRSSADMAAGCVALTEGRAMDAVARFRAAVRGYVDLQLPYEAATARLGVAAACGVSDDCDSEELEGATALAALAEIGAKPVGLAAAWYAAAQRPAEQR